MRLSFWTSRISLAGSLTLLCVAMPLVAETNPQLLTVAESSEFTATATYDEVMNQCRELAKSPNICLGSMGKSHEGRTLPLLIVSSDGIDSPNAAQNDDRLVVFAMANIHAGEVCGKEALLMLAWELSKGEGGALKQLIVLLAPIYNADGNERFARDNRPGQVGPAQGMGQRPNAQGLDLNRDNMKHESPEARSLAQLITDWKPAICIDTHTTNGSYHRYTITYDGPRHPATPGKIVEFTRDKFLPSVEQELATTGYLSFFYGNFNDAHNEWHTYPDLPRYCTHYFGLRGTIGILSEAYAYASYKDRVLATRDFVRSCLIRAVEQQNAIRQVLKAAEQSDLDAEQFAIQSVPIPYREFEALGFVEEGQGRERKATTEHKSYRVTYHGAHRPIKSVRRPFAYLIPAEAKRVVDNLKSHGIRVNQLREETELELETYQIETAELADEEFQGHRTVRVQSTSVAPTKLRYPRGTLIVCTHQPMLGGLIVNLLEPAATDSLCAWNFFDEEVVRDGQLVANADFPIARVLNDVSEQLVDEPR